MCCGCGCIVGVGVVCGCGCGCGWGRGWGWVGGGYMYMYVKAQWSQLHVILTNHNRQHEAEIAGKTSGRHCGGRMLGQIHQPAEGIASRRVTVIRRG